MGEPEQSAGASLLAPVPPVRRKASAPKRLTPAEWESWPDDKLLDLRLCDLGISIRGSELVPRIRELHRELEAAGIGHFRPFFWLSDEWYTPDGVAGVAIPFYLAHPRLARLEFSQMLEVEGGTPEWCMRILRHETGHALDNAYALRRRHRRQKLFGRSSQTYPQYYTPRPYSRSYVAHLEPWYAQSHPDEDFAETFAVWLTPDSPWRKRYQGWPAIKKLDYLDGLMREIGPQAPRITVRRPVDPLARLRKTLREHYAAKHQRYGEDYPNVYDRDLRRLFRDDPELRANLSAAQFIRRYRKDVRIRVAQWTGEYQYTINQVIDEIGKRCRQLNLRLAVPEEQARVDFTIFVAVQTMHYLHSGRHRGVAVKTQRILAIMHEELVPPDGATHRETADADWKMEFDVTVTLKKLGHEVHNLGVGGDLGVIRKAIDEWKPHIVLNLLEDFHGVPVFDQNVVSYLELLRIPYTGCNPRGLMLARDKGLAKKLLSYHRIPIPEFAVYPVGRTKIRRPKRLQFPLIVKSLTREASAGISQASVVEDDDKLAERVRFMHDTFGTDAIVERYVDGRELYVGVLGNQRLQVFPVWELLFTKMPDELWHIATDRVKWSRVYQQKRGIKTAAAKNLPDGVPEHIQHLCRRIYRTLDLSGYARIDLRLDDATGKVYVLEANPNPQLAYGEDFAESAERAGIGYADLLQRIVNLGLRWHPDRSG